MGLRCLLGHDFGDPELKREREERGDEMVVTVREVTTCARCGTERIVSENKEVTSIEQLSRAAADEQNSPSEEGADPAVSTVPGETSGPGARTSEAPDHDDFPDDPATADLDSTATEQPEVTDDAEIITTGPQSTDVDESFSSDDPTHAVESDDSHPTDERTEPTAEPSAAEDDGIILSETDTDAGQPSTRAPGEWPDHDDVATDAGDSEPTPWPDHDGEDEGFDAAEPTEGAPDDVTFSGGFSPEQPAGPSDTSDTSDDVLEPDDGFTRVDTTDVSFERMEDDIRTEFFCPECGLTRQAGRSSMRAGDICPECRRGYISERPLDDPSL
ncbi:DUF7093 family protein [Halalkalirubrum salinum]|uniref:DUF7093 family protein n=1 Tax=Halalkalirubrum salinum TaxID=2563889 RepID=UPI0010FB079C|nr:hypothetical protein [Halalkalirubrum salinum]